MKRLFTFTAILFTVIAFLTGYSYANNTAMEQMKDSIRNAVGGTENVVEDAAKNGADGVKKGFNSLGNTTNSVVHGISDGMNNTTSGYPLDNDNNNDDYTARRTNTTFAGTNGTMWTWLIIGIAAIAVLGFLWYYSMQKASDKNDKNQ